MCLAGGGCLIFSALYLLDFYWPPHLPNQYCALWAGDRLVGRTILLLALALCWAAAIFAAGSYPIVPIYSTVILGPVFVVGIRAVTQRVKPTVSAGVVPGGLSQDEYNDRLRTYAADELDTRRFYAASMCAFLLVGIFSTLVWLCWILANGTDFSQVKIGDLEQEKIYLRKLSPLAVGASNIVYGIILWIRVSLASTYEQGSVMTEVIEQAEEGEVEAPEINHRESVIARHLEDDDARDAYISMTPSQKQRFARRHLKNLATITSVLKLCTCSVLLALGAVYSSASLVAGSGHLSYLIQGFVLNGFGCFFSFMIISFRRTFKAMSEYLKESSLCKNLIAISQADFARGLACALFLPLVPVIFTISAINQCVRKCRKLYDRIPSPIVQTATSGAAARDSSGQKKNSLLNKEDEILVSVSPDTKCLTERIHTYYKMTSTWNWIGVVSWVYIWCFGYSCMVIFQIFFDVFLAWVGKQLAGLGFAIVMLISTLLGMVCFLLPPVPGAVVYLFTGLMCAQNKGDLDFWAATIIAITLGFVMKLCACAMQQKLIGEALGSRESIRAFIGVNKPFFRAIEGVLSAKGLNFKKAAVCVGGPDWPTSVGAGMLKVSLLEMELGTVPVIGFIVPFSLAGAFRTQSDEIYARLTTFMLLLSLVINGVMQLACAWAIQDHMEKNEWECTRPLEKNLALDWIQYREERLAKSTDVTFSKLPGWVRFVSVAGMLACCSSTHLLQWASYATITNFGTFNSYDNIDYLLWWKGESRATFQMGSDGQSACPSLYVAITNSSDCSSAAQSLSKTFSSETCLSSGPTGCVHANSILTYNTCSKAASADQSVVCRDAAIPSGGLIQLPGIMAMALMTGWIGKICLGCYVGSCKEAVRKELSPQLDAEEEEWKRKRIEECQAAESLGPSFKRKSTKMLEAINAEAIKITEASPTIGKVLRDAMGWSDLNAVADTWGGLPLQNGAQQTAFHPRLP
eukprot:TRINITY_DN16157_c0_g1_i3.p1 TRINITY_DN16157_c0_g1~~TRINITY_DN16157_c0_g1_i3.p1  ORF type:complete len:1050 (-),score=123.19 TRINITY_DN16157_c0_g1_i3:8-2926(-)